MYMTILILLLAHILLAGDARGATDVKVNFTLNTTNAYGAPLQQSRAYYVYRPDNLPKTKAVPAVLIFEAGGGGAQGTFLHRKADQAGFLVISCLIAGNSTGNPGTVWTSDDPRVYGSEDLDYTAEVIDRIRASDNAGDVFTAGLSKGGHMSLAYACERPSMIRAAASVDEFMQLPSNVPSAPVPIIFFQGTNDTNVPYTMTRDTLDAWRAVNGLVNATPVTTYESSPRLVGQVSQATWRGGINGTQAAFVTIIGGSHTYATPGVETGYDCSDGMWAFFSQFLTPAEGAPKLVSQPVNNVQYAGKPATFWAAASGSAISYQWRKNGVDIPDANDYWYTLPAATADDNGAEFRVAATNDAGTVISTAAALKVNPMPPGPAITAQPEDQSVTSGQPVTFTFSATGSGTLRYQWKKNGVNIVGATTDTLSIPAAITSDSGASFTVMVTDSAGSTTSNRATLAVARPAGVPIILKNPQRPRVLRNQRASFSVSAWSASPMTYQWQKGPGTGNMSDIPDATEPTYITPLTAIADHLTLFRCVVSNAAGSVTTADEMLFVTEAPTPPAGVSSPVAAFVQVGVPFQFTITVNGGTAPIAFSAAPLPEGLSLDPNSGILSGTPTAAGTTSVGVQVSNSAGSKPAILNLVVTPEPLPVTIGEWRRANFGFSAADPTIAGDDADPDGDGFTNLQEFQTGTNPLDASSVPPPTPLASWPGANHPSLLKSGTSTGALPRSSDSAESGRMELHVAASYTSMGLRPVRTASTKSASTK